MSPIERRIRAGRYEWLCPSDGRWYFRLTSHLRRFHGWRHGPEKDRLFVGLTDPDRHGVRHHAGAPCACHP